MNERETERRLRDWMDTQALPAVPDELRRSVAAIPATVPVGLGDRIAASLGWRQAAAIPSVAWVLLLAGLLLAVVVGGLVAGGLRLDRLVAVQPAPVPAMTIVDEPSDILATTRAKSLPAQATCPPGTDPDATGPADQDRPSGAYVGAVAFDRHAGRMVVLAPDERDPYERAWQTWTYDVCTNTWQRMRLSPAEEPAVGAGLVRLVYDADSDRTLAFTNVNAFDQSVPGATTTYGDIWSYDLSGNRWTKVGTYTWAGNSETHGAVFYHDPSGLIVAYDGATMWAYDGDTNTLATVRQRPDPSLPAEAALPTGHIALGYDPGQDLVVAVVFPHGGAKFVTPYGRNPGPADTWTFDPRIGSWRREAAVADAQLIVCGASMPGLTSPRTCLPTNGRAVFDEASGQTLFLANRAWTSTYVDAYDAGQAAWRTRTVGTDGDGGCSSMPPAYDPLNGRIICLVDGDATGRNYAEAGVSSYSTATGEWRWLLEPSETPAPDATPAPGATPIDWGPPPPNWEQGPEVEPSTNPLVP
jgi:hypothetical protein